MALVKSHRQVDSNYLDFIRTKTCILKSTDFSRGIFSPLDPQNELSSVCIGETSPHHTISRGAEGSDYRAIPLCAFHHNEVHTKGLGFLVNYYFDYKDLIITFLCEFLDIQDEILGRGKEK